MTNEIVEEAVETPEHFIYMQGGIRKKTPPSARCTCNEWSFGPHKSLLTIGMEAKQHSVETGHKLRPHEA